MEMPELSKDDVEELFDHIEKMLKNRRVSKEQGETLLSMSKMTKSMWTTIGKLKDCCMKCARPWRKEANEVYCYAKDDEYHEHALVIKNPESNTCSYFKRAYKTKNYCGYKYGCSLNDNGVCRSSVFCACQIADKKEMP